MVNKRSRLGIFVFYDAEGVVDRYVIYLLERIIPLLDDLVIVVNGELTEKSREKLLHFTNKIIKRENKGYDAMAVKTAMVDFCGWEKLKVYDSVVVFNDTFYGPFFPLEPMFSEMDGKGAALWGTLCRVKGEIYSSTVTVFGTYFYVMNKELLLCPEWRYYWEHLDASEWLFQDAIDKYERALIPLCEKIGLKWDSYLRSDKYAGERKESSFDDYINIPYELIVYHKFPFLKRKPLAESPDFSVGLGYSQKKVLDYIDQCMDYDVGMIWENLLRKFKWWQLKDSLKLTKILREDDIKEKEKKRPLLLIFRVSQEEWISDYYYQWVLLSEVCRIEIFTDGLNIYNKLTKSLDVSNNNISIHKTYDEVQFISILKEVVKEAAYIFYMDDSTYGCESNENLAVGRNVQDFILQSMLESNNYIINVEKQFGSNSYLGAFLPVSIYNNKYLGMWLHGNHEDIVKLFPEMKGYMHELGNTHAFWTRSIVFEEAIMILQEKSDELLSSDMRTPICMMIPGVAQKLGMYTMELINENMASLTLNNQQYILKNMLKNIEMKTGTINEFRDLKLWDLKMFCLQYTKIYIYGSGVWGMRILDKLIAIDVVIDGFIVSDGQRIENVKRGYPIYELCEIISAANREGIIVAISKNHQLGITESLRKRGYNNIYLV